MRPSPFAYGSPALAAVLAGALSAACGQGAAPEPAPALGDYELSAIPESKADDYYSNVSAEFEVRGTIDVQLPPESIGDEAAKQAKIEARLTAVSLFLTTFVTNKLERFFNNMSYGGFSAMARNYTVKPEDVTELEPGRYAVKFSISVAGPKTMPQAIPALADAPAGEHVFELKMPEGFDAPPNDVPRTQIRNFNPETYTGELETIRCTLVPERAARDSYPEFAKMTEDGVFDITLFFGHDYNTPRSDLREAEEAFGHLQDRLGFTPPVATFAELKHDSGPFAKTISMNGKDVAAEVRVFHSDMFTTDRRLGHDTAVAEVIGRDVFFYNGHAGPFYGFYLSDDKPNDVNYLEIPQLSMQDKQQIIVAQGCQTYSQYADVFYANEAKSEANLDVFTTVNFSYGVGTLGIVDNLLQEDVSGRHAPVAYGEMIRQLNAEWMNDWKDVFYGVHGIDGNPKLHPYAALDRIGQACASAGECGDPNGNVCVKKATRASGKVCGAVALPKSRCPNGTTRMGLAQGSTIVSYACVR